MWFDKRGVKGLFRWDSETCSLSNCLTAILVSGSLKFRRFRRCVPNLEQDSFELKLIGGGFLELSFLLVRHPLLFITLPRGILLLPGMGNGHLASDRRWKYLRLGGSTDYYHLFPYCRQT